MKRKPKKSARAKARPRLWVILSDTGGEDRIRDAAVALIRGTRYDANRYARALGDAFHEATPEVIGPVEPWPIRHALDVLAEDALNAPWADDTDDDRSRGDLKGDE